MQTTIRAVRNAPRACRPWDLNVQHAADMIGLIPGLNVPAEIVSGLISLRRKDYVGLALSVAGLVPVEGEWAVAVKLARSTHQAVRVAEIGCDLARGRIRARQPVRKPTGRIYAARTVTRGALRRQPAGRVTGP